MGSQLLGAAVGGFVTNITATVVATEGTPFAGLIATGLNGLANEYPKFKDIIDDSFSTLHLQKFSLGEECLIPAIIQFLGNRFFSGPLRYFEQGWDIFKNDYINTMLNNNTLALEDNDEIPTIPLFIFSAIEDEIVPIHDVQRTYTNWCDWKDDISIEFAADKTGGHLTEFIQGIPAGFAWLNKLFSGTGIITGCARTERLNNLEYPGADHSLYEALDAGVKRIFGQDVGPNGENADFSSLNL